MTLHSCSHELEMKTLLDDGHWPHASPPELRAHVAGCRTCANQVLITQAFRADRTASARAVHLPPPGVLWWRAELRRRNAAVERIGRPILGAQIFALVITLLITAAIILTQARHGLRWLAQLRHSPVFHMSSLWSASYRGATTLNISTLDAIKLVKAGWDIPSVVPGLVMLAFLSGIVVYLASERQ